MKKITGTKEWANHNLNIISGCKNDCAYCYAKSMAVRFKRHSAASWEHPVVVSELIIYPDDHKCFNKRSGTIMYPSTHDISFDMIKYHIKVLRNLLKAGNKILIVSKPDFKCIKILCDTLYEYKENILFRFTISSLNQRILDIWEHKAPSISSRLKSLKYAYAQGFKTSVSDEPDLDINTSDILFKFQFLSHYVSDYIWWGKMNQGLTRLKFNNRLDLLPELNQLIDFQKDDNIKIIYRMIQNSNLAGKMKYKESIKKVLNMKLNLKKGMDT